MKHILWGLIACSLVSAVMAFGWMRYKEFLTQGMRPTESTLKLNKMADTGVPHFEMQDISGKTVKLTDFSDKVVILNFWASWCAPCVKEFPSMIRLLKQFPDDVVLLAVSHDKTEDDLMSFLNAFDVKEVLNFIVIWDKSTNLAKEYGTEVLPESYILRPGLKLERKVAGVEEWDQPLAIQYFQSLVDAPSPQ